jgi:hypothetical protein
MTNSNQNQVEHRRKMTVSGGLVEVLHYDFIPHSKSLLSPVLPASLPEPSETSLAHSVRRAKRTLSRLIYSNDLQHGQYTKLLTLTNKKKLGLSESATYFKNFVKRLNYQMSLDLKYVAVPEFHPKGHGVHYHAVLFNLPFMDRVYKRLFDLWGQQRLELDVLQAHSDVEYVVPYISKYISKQFFDKRYFGRRRYYPSQGLKKPIEVTNDVEIQMVLPYLEPNLKYQTEYLLPYIGSLKYFRYFVANGLQRQFIFDKIGVTV